MASLVMASVGLLCSNSGAAADPDGRVADVRPRAAPGVTVNTPVIVFEPKMETAQVRRYSA
jgi:hypothetical protein